MSASPGLTATRLRYRRETTYRETSVMLAVFGLFIVAAYVVDVIRAGRPELPSALVRLAWGAALLAEARLMRSASHRDILRSGTAVIVVSAIAFLALVATTGMADSPLILFGYVLAMTLPLIAWELMWVGFAAGLVVVATVTVILLPGAASIGDRLAIIHVGAGAVISGLLLGRALVRARATEERVIHRLELALGANEHLVGELREALASVRTLEGLMPVCAWCHRARTDEGYWQQLDAYVAARTGVQVTHALCPECAAGQLHDLDEAGSGAVEIAPEMAGTA